MQTIQNTNTNIIQNTNTYIHFKIQSNLNIIQKENTIYFGDRAKIKKIRKPSDDYHNEQVLSCCNVILQKFFQSERDDAPARTPFR